jgi:hypothetical protein
VSPLLAVCLALATSTSAPTFEDAHVRVRMERAPRADFLRGGDVPAVLLLGPGCTGPRAVYLDAHQAAGRTLGESCEVTRLDLKTLGSLTPGRVAAPHPPTDPRDAVAAAPASHRVLLENGAVRVLEVIIPPESQEPFHGHEWPSVFIADVQTHFRMYVPGRDQPVADRPARSGVWIAYFDPEAVHSVQNLDATRAFHALRVELKVPVTAATGSGR